MQCVTINGYVENIYIEKTYVDLKMTTIEDTVRIIFFEKYITYDILKLDRGEHIEISGTYDKKNIIHGVTMKSL